jgi:hypothetical protein
MSKAPETTPADMTNAGKSFQDAAATAGKAVAKRNTRTDPTTGEIIQLPAGVVEISPGKYSRDSKMDVAPATAITNEVVIGTDDDFSPKNVTAKQGGLKPKQLVSVPVLSFPAGTEVLVQFGCVIHLGKPIPDPETGRMKRLDVAEVRAQSGAMRTLICGEVLKNELENGYPDGTYVGRWFYIKKFEPNAEKRKRYATYEIIEVEDPRGLGNTADSAKVG